MIHSGHGQAIGSFSQPPDVEGHHSDYLHDGGRRPHRWLRLQRPRRQSWRPVERDRSELGPLRRAFLGLVAVTGTVVLAVGVGFIGLGVLVQAVIAGVLLGRL